jgi:hypothetical protein
MTPSIIDENIKASESLYGRANHSLRCPYLSYIAGDGEDFAPLGPNFFSDTF